MSWLSIAVLQSQMEGPGLWFHHCKGWSPTRSLSLPSLSVTSTLGRRRQVGEGTYGHVFEAETCITGLPLVVLNPKGWSSTDWTEVRRWDVGV